MDWKVYYEDGTTFSGDASVAPVMGVLVIIEKDPLHGRRIITNADYYVWDDRGEGMHWWEADFVGLVDYLIKPGMKRVLIGRLTSNSVFQEVYDKAYNDPDFETKTAFSLRHHGRKA